MSDTTDQPPVWLLDIDGVINATVGPHHIWPADQWITHRINGYNIRIAQPVLDFITEVHTGGFAEIRWHSTWQHDAHLLEDAYGLPRLAIQDCPEYATRHTVSGWFKLAAAERVAMNEARNLLWTDDDISSWRLIGATTAIDMIGKAVPFLAISPKSSDGLTARNLRRIRDWLGMPDQPTANTVNGHNAGGDPCA